MKNESLSRKAFESPYAQCGRARYFLDGIRTRLQTRRHTSTEVNRGRKDIAALRTPLEDSREDGLRTRLARLQQLKRQFSGALDQRLFWLEAEDIEEHS
eukprot:s3_g28.t1